MASLGAAQNAVNSMTQSLSSAGSNAGVANNGPAREKDRTTDESQTAPQFGEVMQNIQAKYGARPEKGREIKKTLGKDDFLRIMITQMKNQDPTNPFKAEQMASQMAQFTTVEQLKNMGDAMNKLTTANQPLEKLAMTNMIGKSITIDRGRFPHTEGQKDALSFGLPKDAAEVTVSIISDQGETILQKNLGKTSAGEGSFAWDGNKSNSLPAKSGNYMIRVDAQDAQGAKIETNSQAQARVIGVSFEGSEPVFLVGDNQHQEKITMKNIVRIDDNGQQPAVMPSAGAQPGQSAGGIQSSVQSKAGPAFFGFQKGVGSTPVDPDTQRALAAYQSGNPQTPEAAAVPPQGVVASAINSATASIAEEKGFPNGLHDDEVSRDTQKGGKSK